MVITYVRTYVHSNIQQLSILPVWNQFNPCCRFFVNSKVFSTFSGWFCGSRVSLPVTTNIHIQYSGVYSNLIYYILTYIYINNDIQYYRITTTIPYSMVPVIFQGIYFYYVRRKRTQSHRQKPKIVKLKFGKVQGQTT